MDKRTIGSVSIVSSCMRTNFSRLLMMLILGLMSTHLYADDAAERERNLKKLQDEGWDEPYRWGIDKIPYVVGDAYRYEVGGSYNYYRIAKLNDDGTVAPPPGGQTDSRNWEYLGDAAADAPNIRVDTWGTKDRKGTIGDIYIYSNPYMNVVQYFKLKGFGSDGRYWYFPTDATDNQYWTYMGTDYPG